MERDVDMLIPEQENEDAVPSVSESAEEISRMFFKVGVAQLVLGLLLIGGGIATTVQSYGEDVAGQGIWGGIFVVICGSLAITARYHLFAAVVIASLVINLVTSLLLTAGIILAAVSTFGSLSCIYCWRSTAIFAGNVTLNCGICGCLVLSIYLAIVFSKILNEKKNLSCDCCLQGSTADREDQYRMVYVPPGINPEAHPQNVGAFMAVPAAQPL